MRRSFEKNLSERDFMAWCFADRYDLFDDEHLLSFQQYVSRMVLGHGVDVYLTANGGRLSGDARRLHSAGHDGTFCVF